MKRSKTLWSLFATLFLSFALACCGGTPGTSVSTSEPDGASSSESGSEVPVEPVETEYLDAVKSPDYPEIAQIINYTVYYVDSESGSDANDGLTEGAAKASLAAVNLLVKGTVAEKPVKILFKAGSEYSGTLTLTGFKAAEESPLIVGVYGQNENNKYAKIVGPEQGNCVEIKSGNVRVSGLECTSPLGYRGIHVTTNAKGAMKNIVVSDCYCHDINFDTSEVSLPSDGSMPGSSDVQKMCPDGRFSYNCGGIVFEADTPAAKGASWYENVWIDNNIVERVARTGIWVFSNWAQRPGVDWGRNPYYDDETNWFHHSNVNIRGNQILYSGGDGIILGVTVGAFIEYNVCYHAQILGRPNYYCAGIWSHSCKNIVFQYNEAAYTHTARDGQGFDIDIGNSDVLFQYNYSHHNDGGGLLCCNTTTNLVQYDAEGNMLLDEDGLPVTKKVMAPWSDVTIKNNVFADNSVADLILSGTVNNVVFDNNTVVKAGITANEKVIDTKDFYTGIPGDNWFFGNNIFYMRKTNSARFAMEFSTSYVFRNNVYYGFQDTFEEYMREEAGETEYVCVDPQFGSTEAGLGLGFARLFVPRNPAIFEGSGSLAKMLKYDFLGNDVSGVNYYGAIGMTSD